MKQRPNDQIEYGRTTITVPKPLKKRMRQAGLGVNWSAVACEAFRKKLKSLQEEPSEVRSNRLPSKQEAISRLKDLKREGNSQAAPLMHEGIRKGQRWAMTIAHPDELDRFEHFCDEHRLEEPPETWKVDVEKAPQFKRLLRQLAVELLQPNSENAPNKQQGRQRPGVAFWEQQVGLTSFPPEPVWIQGFAKGSLQFWREVKSEVLANV